MASNAASSLGVWQRWLPGLLLIGLIACISLPGCSGCAQRAKIREASARHAAMRDIEFALDDAASSLVLRSGYPPPPVWRRNQGQPTLARVYVGDGNALELVSLHVSVVVEGPRARTVVDHIFRNPHERQLEGTFEYPLPTGASPSYYAMFLGARRDTLPARFGPRGEVPAPPADALARLTPEQLVTHIDRADWGEMRQGRVVNNQKALESYEEITRARIDPALLEYASGNTFRGRVFPIAPKGYNRVLIAYEETLPVVAGKLLYRFTLPNRDVQLMNFTLRASASECVEPVFTPEAKRDEANGQVTFTRAWEKEKPQGEVQFRATPREPRVQAIAGRHGDNGPRYLYARLRPHLPAAEKSEPFAEHAVFLLDTSLSEHPERFAVSMKLLRSILEQDSDLKHFNVLVFNAGAAWLEPNGWLANTEAGREQALARLDGTLLEGATDLSAALERLAKPGWDSAKGTPLNVFLLSDGNLTWGETEIVPLVSRFERDCPFACRFHCYRTGLGAENQELYEALTRKGGGIFNCYAEADVASAGRAHRSHCLQIDKVRLAGVESQDLLVAGRRAAVYPGGELIVAARVNSGTKGTLVLEGTYRGQKLVEEFPLEVGGSAELAPRAWGEVAVASLLALNDEKLEPLATAYCQQFGIASRVASFLVLETDNDYKRFNLDQERGRTVEGDLAEFLAAQWAVAGRASSPRDSFTRFLKQVDGKMPVLQGENGPHVSKLLGLLEDRDFELAVSALAGAIVAAKDANADYLAARKQDRRDVAVYLTEARRRVDAGDRAGAIRVLSSILEEHAGRSDALRLVGYRLLDFEQASEAARLFGRVQRQRPFEPHSYRDLARALEDAGLYGLAAINYEIVLAGTWHNRFRSELQLVVREEYTRMMQEAIRKKAVRPAVADHFGERLEKLIEARKPADLRVTISWNTDATDVDLWVFEPDGTKCFYQNQRTPTGGELSADQTQGYGPERYQIAEAKSGTYTVLVHYFASNPNLLGGETHVNVVVTRFAGTPRETVERRTVILKSKDELIEVCKIRY
jgi:hypothetical protein